MLSLFGTGTLAAAALAASPALAGSVAERYTVSVTIKDGGKVVGAPTITLDAGKPARMSTAAYAVALTVRREAGMVWIASKIDLPGARGLVRAATPNMLIREGQPAMMTYATTKATGRPLELTLTVTR